MGGLADPPGTAVGNRVHDGRRGANGEHQSHDRRRVPSPARRTWHSMGMCASNRRGLGGGPERPEGSRGWSWRVRRGPEEEGFH